MAICLYADRPHTSVLIQNSCSWNFSDRNTSLNGVSCTTRRCLNSRTCSVHLVWKPALNLPGVFASDTSNRIDNFFFLLNADNLIKLTRRKYPGKNKRAPWETGLLETTDYLVFSRSEDVLYPWEPGLLSETFDCQRLGKKCLNGVCKISVSAAHAGHALNPCSESQVTTEVKSVLTVPSVCVAQGHAQIRSAVGAAPGMPRAYLNCCIWQDFALHFPSCR